MGRSRGVCVGYKIGSNAGNIYWLDNSGYKYLYSRRLNYDKLLLDKAFKGMLGSKYCKNKFIYDKCAVHGKNIELSCIMGNSDYYLNGFSIRSNKRKSFKKKTDDKKKKAYFERKEYFKKKELERQKRTEQYSKPEFKFKRFLKRNKKK